MTGRTPHRGVVVGTDGSPPAQTALQWAACEAALRHVPLTVAHVTPSLPVAASLAVWPTGRVPEEVLEEEEADARAVIDAAVALVRELGGGDRPEVTSELLFGRPVPTLVDLSKEASMLVVGCRGHSARDRRLLGSVTTGLLHHAHCPVAVIHDEAQLVPNDDRPVLVGIDGSRASESATAIAFDEASWRAVELVALHVWSDADMRWARGIEDSALQAAAETTLAESLAGWQERYPEVTVHRLVEIEYPATRILEHAARAQLVVVGSHGRGGFTGMLLGSVSAAVAHTARVPVIVARRR